MQIVHSYNEWDPLEEVILGVPDFWCTPHKEPAYDPPFRPGKHSDEHIKLAATQYDNLERVLKNQCNITVRRPEILDYTQPVKTPFFSVPLQHGASCPRDSLLVIGNEIIESTMSRRCRYFESMAYRNILNDYMDRDPEMLWTMAPKPTMEDTMYNLDFPWDVKSTERKTWTENHKYQINETQPVFDAAEVLRLGKDLIVQHSLTTNRKGIEWLRRHTKARGYRVHEIHFKDKSPVHIDCSLIPLIPPSNERKGILMCNPDWPMDERDSERLFKGSNWDIIEAPRCEIQPPLEMCEFRIWLDINILLLSPRTVLVEEKAVTMTRFLESYGMKCIPVPHRDCYRFGGSFHCHTLDVRRRGERVNYFPNLDE